MAYLSASDLQDESSWWYTNWQPRLDSTSFATFLGRVCTRVGNHVKFRVGATAYATTDATQQAVLMETELCLAQFYLCLAVATIADSSEDPTQNPVAGAGLRLRDDGLHYLARAESLLGWIGTAQWNAKAARPRATTGGQVEELVPHAQQTTDWAREE